MGTATNEGSSARTRDVIALAIGIPTAVVLGSTAGKLGYGAAAAIPVACLSLPVTPCLISAHPVRVGALVGAALGVTANLVLNGGPFGWLMALTAPTASSLVVSLPLSWWRTSLAKRVLRWSARNVRKERWVRSGLAVLWWTLVVGALPFLTYLFYPWIRDTDFACVWFDC